MKKILTRIPPSPTGLLHIGTVRTALYNYLFAKHHGGTMVFRIEDTDKERGTPEFERNIIDGLVQLGIAGDEGVHKGGPHGPYRQSERTEIYRKYLHRLVAEDKAYFCFCSKDRLEEMRQAQIAAKRPTRYDGTCSGLFPAESRQRVEEGERAVIRLRVPEGRGDVAWEDGVRGPVAIHSRELDDFVIARGLDDPLYHLTVVADDHDMQITHVIRGEDHISNTPKQILIFEAFGWDIPAFAHLPLILNEDKTKLSKRKNKVAVQDYLEDGILPEALLNFLALLGWNTPDEQELFSMEELVEKFTLEAVHKGGAVFDLKKLEWVNGEYIKKAIAQDTDGFYERAKPFLGALAAEDPQRIKAILRDPDFEGRFKKLSEIPEALGCLFGEVADYPKELILSAKFSLTPELLTQVMEAAIEVTVKMEWARGDMGQAKTISDTYIGLVEKLGLKNGQVLWPIRVALSGLDRSPGFATLAVHLGKAETLERLGYALEKVS